MKIIIGLSVLLVAAYVWLRAQWARSKNGKEAGQIITDLRSGKYVIESYADALGVMILSKALPAVFDPAVIRQRLRALTGKQVQQKFTVQFADMNENGKGILIAEAKSSELVAGYSGSQQVDIHFPCWIYIDTDRERQVVDFRSTFPEHREHHYLLEDLCGEIYKQHLQA